MSRAAPAKSSPVGQQWLRERLGIRVPPQAAESYVHAGARRTESESGRKVDYYPPHYSLPEDPTPHIKFAFKHEAIDLGLLVSALRALGAQVLEDWVRNEPTGAYSRRAWFLYEWSTGERLDLPDTKRGNYVPLLDERRHFVAAPKNSVRHRVRDNLLGTPRLCPTVRKTERLLTFTKEHVDREALDLLERVDRATLTRAVNYLYTKETRSSFAIEGEKPSADRAWRFVAALKAAHKFDAASADALTALQGQIVDPRYAASGWRTDQNFVGETVAGYREEVHFIPPRPEDVPDLMRGWFDLYRRTISSELDPVIVAAVLAFAFVFIHPFDDGNGRIHRFLIHHVLATRRFSPPDIIFPVSASIVRDQRSYDEALEAFSRPVLDLVQWNWSLDREVVVENKTDDLYRYFDATLLAEYLYGRVEDAVKTDLREELEFVSVFDAAVSAVRQVVDMPDRKLSLFVRLCLQNNGRLSNNKRKQFEELTEKEIEMMELAVHRAATEGGKVQSVADERP
jgi:hypothetical protein